MVPLAIEGMMWCGLACHDVTSSRLSRPYRRRPACVLNACTLSFPPFGQN